MKIHDFYKRNNLRVHQIPVGSKFPPIKGWPDLNLPYDEVEQKLKKANEFNKYGWALDDCHLVIDVDMHSEAENGLESLAKFDAENGLSLDDCCKAIVQTPSGGRHYYFLKPPGIELKRTQKKTHPAIDFLSKKGKQVVAANSAHDTHPGTYEINEDAELVEIPKLILDRLIEMSDKQFAAQVVSSDSSDRSGQEFNSSALGLQTMIGELHKAGYTTRNVGDYCEFDRPGKSTGSKCSGYVGKKSKQGNYQLTSFSLSDPNFPSGDSINIFHAFALLAFGGDHVKAAARLFDLGFAQKSTEDFSDFMVTKPKAAWTAETPKTKTVECDPFPFPKSIYDADGIISQFVKYAIETAPRPRPELAVACALSMIGVITGRKIRNKSGLRTNIYMIGLAESGSGKDWSRKCCREIFSVAAMQDYLAAENPASGAALVTAIHEHPSSLFQIDEINRYFSSIKNAGGKSPFLNEVFDILMKLNDQCTNPAWSPKGYGESKKNKIVPFPHCCIFGTGTPDGFWGSVKSSDATDGFLARMVVIEASAKHPRKVDAESKEPPKEIVERILEWHNWYGGAGNLASAIPQVQIIPIDSAAKDRLWTHSEGIEDRLQDETREQRTIWSRTAATAEKLAMIFACSRGPSGLLVSLNDAERAVLLANWATRLLVRRVFSSVSENEEESKRKRVFAIIAEGPISLNALTRRTQWLRGARERKDVLDDLLEAELIELGWGEKKDRPGKVAVWYRQIPTLTSE